jgi:NAD(P)-dependent dehydrogenase (short-subunit alcohol dehydrogenase family)
VSIFERLFSLEGKTALVTGGATGIGRMIATGLVMAGANVMIASRKAEDCVKVAEEINAEAKASGAKGQATGFGGNVANEEGVNALAKEVSDRADKLDILFNNAGTSWGAPIEDFPYAAWSRVLDLNVTGLFNLTKLLLPLLDKAASPDSPARVVNLGSVMGTAALGDGAYSYSVSKAAVHHLTRILGKELAHRHITFNAFAPGPFPSKMTAHATATADQREVVAKSVPLGRVGTPDDIAAAAIYLCSHGGSYVTGCILPLDGGIHVMSGPNLFDEASKV